MKRLRLVPLLLVPVLALAGCSDDAETAAEADDGACADLESSAVSVVGRTPAGDEDEQAAAIDRLAAHPDGDLAEPAETLSGLLVEPEDASSADMEAGLDALLALGRWAAGHCDFGAPIWGCNAQSAFTPVGEPVGVDPPEPADDPRAVAVDRSNEGDLVEVSRSDDEALYAWVDDDGLAQSSLAVVPDPDGGWVAGRSSSCNPS